MEKICIITNIPSPYRVDFFCYLQATYNDYGVSIIYSSKMENNRNWSIDKEKLVNSYYLKSRTIKLKTKIDYKFIHIPFGVKKQLNYIKPNYVVSMEYNPTSIKALGWCRRNGIPYISWTDGTLNSEKSINFMQKAARRYIIKNAQSYIASSTKSKEAQIAYGALADRIFVSYLSVDMEQFPTIEFPKNPHQIIFVGSLIKRKGIDLLLKGISKVTAEYTLLIVGDGPEKKALKMLASELGIGTRVKFSGFLNGSELIKAYKESELFVLPTREDCYALVILEAICCGLPVICSKYADGAYDLIEDKKSGFVIDPYNEDELKEKIQELLLDENKREQFSKCAQNNKGKFHFRETAEKFMQAVKSTKQR